LEDEFERILNWESHSGSFLKFSLHSLYTSVNFLIMKKDCT
jgi:hypothetical protein